MARDPRSGNLVAFSRSDADQLVNLIGERADVTAPPPQPQVRPPRLFRFTLNENMGATSSNKADADILYPSGTDTGIDADVEDPAGLRGDLKNGDAGWCLSVGGAYYIIDASPGGLGDISIAVAPGGGISARSGTTAGSGTCTLYYLNGSAISADSDSVTVYNWSQNAVTASAYIMVGRDRNGVWWVLAEDCA